jgi:hypothetical protein
MWQTHRIACITYHKYPKGSWPESEFHDTQLTLPNGEQVSLPLAERGSWIGSRQQGLWVREIRKLTESGHQTSLISSAYGHEGLQDAGALFSRWSQENFFRYAMQHFGIDLLSEYGTDGFPEPKRPVVNPARRELDTRRRSLQSRLMRQRAQYAALTLHPEADLHPDESRGQLAIRIHPFSNLRSNRAIEHLLEQLNASEMKHPGTSLTLTYSLIGTTQN